MSPRGGLRAARAWAITHAHCALASLGVLWRSPFASALTAAVIGVALALPAGAWLVVDGLLDVSARFTQTADLSVFLKMDVSDSRALALGGEVGRHEGVAAVRTVTREDALEEFRSAAGLGYGVESMGGVNPLPTVLVVSPRSDAVADLDALANWLGALPEVEFVQADRDWLARLRAMMEVAQRLLWLLAVLLASGIVLVVGNTLRLSIEARRAEVEIAKLFGASDAFVRRPFLYHGLYYGLGGGCIACLLLLLGGLFLRPPLQALAALYGEPALVSTPGAGGLLAVLATGATLGLLAAWLWVGRQLHAVEPR